MTPEIPEFHYCASCGFLDEGGRGLRCNCVQAQPRRLKIRPEQVNEIRDAINRVAECGSDRKQSCKTT